MITENSKEDCEKFYMFRDDILGDGMCEDVQRECRVKKKKIFFNFKN
jgi:hypothetical protein